jgi:hypothetical protein
MLMASKARIVEKLKILMKYSRTFASSPRLLNSYARDGGYFEFGLKGLLDLMPLDQLRSGVCRRELLREVYSRFHVAQIRHLLRFSHHITLPTCSAARSAASASNTQCKTPIPIPFLALTFDFSTLLFLSSIDRPYTSPK